VSSEFADLIGLAQNRDDDWTSNIPDGWDFMGVPNGGLVSSIMATALISATERPDPITSTAHFLRPARPGPVVIETEIIRKGRTLTTARAALTQNDTLVAHMVSSLGDLAETGEAIVDIDLPQLPPSDKCVREREAKPFEFPAIAQRMNIRLHPDQVGFATGHPNGEAVVSGWVDIPFASSTALMPLVADALPPSLFNTGKYLGPLPTIELTVHTHARPSPGPVAARFRTDHAGPRYVEEDGWINDSSGKLISVSRQIAILPAR
jgi:hypothetical protein